MRWFASGNFFDGMGGQGVSIFDAVLKDLEGYIQKVIMKSSFRRHEKRIEGDSPLDGGVI